MQANLPLFPCMIKNCEQTMASVQELVEHSHSSHQFTLNSSAEVIVTGLSTFNNPDSADIPMKDLEIINSEGKLCSIKAAYKFSYALYEIFNFISIEKTKADSAGYEGDALGSMSRSRPYKHRGQVHYENRGIKEQELKKIYDQYNAYGFDNSDVFLDFTARYGELAYLIALRQNITCIAVESFIVRFKDAQEFYAKILKIFETDKDIVSRLQKIDFVFYNNCEEELQNLFTKYSPTHIFAQTARMKNKNAYDLLSNMCYGATVKMIIWGKDNQFFLRKTNGSLNYKEVNRFKCINYDKSEPAIFFVFRLKELNDIQPRLSIAIDRDVANDVTLLERVVKAALAWQEKNPQPPINLSQQQQEDPNEMSQIQTNRRSELHEFDKIVKRQRLNPGIQEGLFDFLWQHFTSKFPDFNYMQMNPMLLKVKDLNTLYEKLMASHHENKILFDMNPPQYLEINEIQLSTPEIEELVGSNFPVYHFLQLNPEEQEKWIEIAVYLKEQKRFIEQTVNNLCDISKEYMYSQTKCEDLTRKVPLLQSQLEKLYQIELGKVGVIVISKQWEGHSFIMLKCQLNQHFDNRGAALPENQIYNICVPILGNLQDILKNVKNAHYHLQKSGCMCEILREFDFYDSKGFIMKGNLQTLSDYIEKNLLTQQQKGQIIRKLVNVFAQAGMNGIYHLNLDTKCIFINEDNPLLFFPGGTDILVGGSPGYQPPEQFTKSMKPVWNRQPNLKKVDSYALGIILFQITFHRHPFDQQQLAEMEFTGRLPPLPQEITQRLQNCKLLDAIEQLLQEDPDDRYTAEQLIKKMPLYYERY